MIVRKAEATDHDQVWSIFSAVIKTGDTYVFDPGTSRKELNKHWFADYMETYVAEEGGKIFGSYIIKPNQIDLGNHIANASYMIHPDAQGKGIGKLLCEHSIALARKSGYFGMQFNIVVSTNTAAVNLWKRYGFKIIGTTPNGFRHKKLGLVDTYIMYLEL